MTAGAGRDDRIARLDPARQALLARLQQQRAAASPPAPAMSARYPVSATQFGMWLFDQLHPDSAAYHNPAAVVLDGRVDVDALRAALADVQAHHSALRTRLVETDDGVPEQVVDPTAPLDVEVVEAAADEAVAAVSAHASRPFDLAAGPIWRTLVVRAGDGRDVVAVTSHHVVSDGWSLAVLFGDLDAAYAARRAGSPPAPAPAGPPFGSFVQADEARLGAGERGRLRAWWQEALAGAPTEIALPGASGAGFGAAAGTVPVSVDAAVAAELEAVARASRSSLFGAVLALYAVVLREHSGQDDLVITTPVARRGDPASHRVIGCFLNTVPLRVRIEPGATFASLVHQCGGVIRSAVAHSLLPFAEIAAAVPGSRSTGGSLSNVMLVHNNAEEVPAALFGLPAAAFPLPVKGVKQDWALHLAISGRGLAGQLEYSAARFQPAAMAEVARELQAAAEARARRPDAPLHAAGAGR